MGHLTLNNMMSAGDNIFSHLVILSSPGAQWNYFLLRRGRRITRVAGVVCCTAQLAPTWDVKQSIAGCVPPGNFWVCKLSSCGSQRDTACKSLHSHAKLFGFSRQNFNSTNRVAHIRLNVPMFPIMLRYVKGGGLIFRLCLYIIGVKVHFAVVGDTSQTVVETHPNANVGTKQSWLARSRDD